MGLKYVSAYLMAALGGKDAPTEKDIKKILDAAECEYDADVASKLVSELEGKTIHEVIAANREKLKNFGGGGGGGGGAAAAPAAGGGEAKKEEAKKVVEEEEEEEDMDFDLFG
eukprot:gnl/MRDRNA2_/MRDRNA2_87164_c0_seq1.p2 gnl/MRDRNA2_/MRDRNA2_87164_c0~~gnl/MRDRNA2_/MRDRNA2_87164_c0_seq1.p2  ORF type:complete len:113 (+),score=51.05 gnl/MRDRNA2_/MRDRNA2_87164_c0_seq1:96-434(+)